MDSGQFYDAAIVGGGLAGTTVAAELALLAPANFRLLLIAANEPGPGRAYSAPSERLYMNGTALAMSAVSGDKRHLVRWLRTQPEQALIPRAQFGRYLAERFREALARRPDFEVVRGGAVDLLAEGEGFAITDASGNRYRARNVVLALGNFPPDDSFLPQTLREYRGFVSDPWRFDPPEALEGDVLVIGSGLTAMDAVALLEERRLRGSVHLVSRHALLPLVENPLARELDLKTLGLRTDSPGALLRSLRSAAREHVARGGDWRDVVESMRATTPSIWRQWTQRDRQRFLRHLQTYWAIHRYRVPPETAAAFARLDAAGRIHRHRGSIAGARAATGGSLDVAIAQSGKRLDVGISWALNCTGPNGDYRRVGDPLVRNLLRRGIVRCDPLHLGLEATPQLRLIGSNGRAHEALFALGPPVRGLWYETTAVPETREQAAYIAREIGVDLAGAQTLETAS
jgi:uncharacterized NAD(P)/FAD-binding protein YdhS